MQSEDGSDVKYKTNRPAATTALHREEAHKTEADLNVQAYRVVSKATLGVLLFTVAFVYAMYHGFKVIDPAEANQCKMAYMSPAYVRLEGLDIHHSRLAGKYSLWLYREQGWDLSNKVCHRYTLLQHLVNHIDSHFLLQLASSLMEFLSFSLLGMQAHIDRFAVLQLLLRGNITKVLEHPNRSCTLQDSENWISFQASNAATGNESASYYLF